MTDKRKKIIELWAKGMGTLDIAKELGCDKSTVVRAKQSPECFRAYQLKCNNSVAELVPLAVQALQDVLSNPKERGSVKITAAKEVLDRAGIRYIDESDGSENTINVNVTYE